MKKEPLFQEEQKFTQRWLWLILIGVTLLPIYGVWQQVIMGEIFGDKPMTDEGLIVTAIGTVLLLVFFWLFKMTTTITEKEITIKWFPFGKKIIAWDEIESAKVINYGFVGGWGIRYSLKHGMVYNLTGNMGLAIFPKQGKNFVIGTQRRDVLQHTLDQLSRQSSESNQS